MTAPMTEERAYALARRRFPAADQRTAERLEPLYRAEAAAILAADREYRESVEALRVNLAALGFVVSGEPWRPSAVARESIARAQADAKAGR